MKTSTTDNRILKYLDNAIDTWRDIRDGKHKTKAVLNLSDKKARDMIPCYINAYQDMRDDLFGSRKEKEKGDNAKDERPLCILTKLEMPPREAAPDPHDWSVKKARERNRKVLSVKCPKFPLVSEGFKPSSDWKQSKTYKQVDILEVLKRLLLGIEKSHDRLGVVIDVTEGGYCVNVYNWGIYNVELQNSHRFDTLEKAIADTAVLWEEHKKQNN